MQRKLHRRIASLYPYTFLVTGQVPYLHWKSRLGNVEAGIHDIRPNVRFQPMTILRGP